MKESVTLSKKRVKELRDEKVKLSHLLSAHSHVEEWAKTQPKTAETRHLRKSVNDELRRQKERMRRKGIQPNRPEGSNLVPPKSKGHYIDRFSQSTDKYTTSDITSLEGSVPHSDNPNRYEPGDILVAGDDKRRPDISGQIVVLEGFVPTRGGWNPLVRDSEGRYWEFNPSKLRKARKKR